MTQYVADPAEYIGPKASAPAYTHRLTIRADEIETPSTGPKWQIVDARDEVTWHDLDAVVDCNLGDRCPDKVPGRECVVLVGKAWADGFAHMPEDTPVVVRIPAEVSY